MSIIIQAAQFAAAKHAGQLRKWTQRPYIEHPGRVAAAVTLLPGVSDEIIAAAAIIFGGETDRALQW